MKKLDKAYIKATEYPDWDYVINQLLELADRINAIVDHLNEMDLDKLTKIILEVNRLFHAEDKEPKEKTKI